MQRQLQEISKRCKRWCLDLKDENNLQWDKMNQNLSEGQADLSLGETCLKEKGMRQDFRASTDIKLDYWKQRARVKWDNLRDQPTSFFYQSMKTRKGKNDIRAIKILWETGLQIRSKQRRNSPPFFAAV